MASVHAGREAHGLEGRLGDSARVRHLDVRPVSGPQLAYPNVRQRKGRIDDSRRTSGRRDEGGQ
jgi:hypothetical protein